MFSTAVSSIVLRVNPSGIRIIFVLASRLAYASVGGCVVSPLITAASSTSLPSLLQFTAASGELPPVPMLSSASMSVPSIVSECDSALRPTDGELAASDLD